MTGVLYVLTLYTLTPKGEIYDRQIAAYRQSHQCEVARWALANVHDGKVRRCITVFTR
jgi:hypothetical protein